MTDFIKLKTTIPDWEQWQQSASHVELVGRYVHGTGELVCNRFGTVTYDGECGGYRIVVKRPDSSLAGNCTHAYLDVKGSMHKACRDGENYSTFSWPDLQAEIGRLSSLFLLDEHSAVITNFEFGVNVELPFDIQAFVHDHLLLYKHREFSSYPCDRRGRSIGRECSFSQYTVKAYDKGLQYNLPRNLFRFELKYRSTQAIRSLGIEHLSDLRNRDKVIRLAEMLMDAWDDVLICEPSLLTIIGLTAHDMQLSRDGANPKYWMRLRRENRKAFEHKRRAYRELKKKHGHDLHAQVGSLLRTELNRMLQR